MVSIRQKETFMPSSLILCHVAAEYAEMKSIENQGQDTNGKASTLITTNSLGRLYKTHLLMNKVTKESIEAKIKEVRYQRLSDKITHCIIILENGFQVTGESACVDPANYNQEIGERISYENAFDKIWLIEGYLLQEKMFQGLKPPVA